MIRGVRKVLANGSSKAMTLPSDWALTNGLKPGDDLEVLYDSEQLIVRPVKAQEGPSGRPSG